MAVLLIKPDNQHEHLRNRVVPLKRQTHTGDLLGAIRWSFWAAIP